MIESKVSTCKLALREEIKNTPTSLTFNVKQHATRTRRRMMKKDFFGITKIDLIRLINSQVWRHTGYASRTSVVYIPLSLRPMRLSTRPAGQLMGHGTVAIASRIALIQLTD